MRIVQCMSTRQIRWVGNFMILSLLLGSFPFQLVFTANSSQENIETHSLSTIGGFNRVPRLTRTTSHVFDIDPVSNADSTEFYESNRSALNFAMGSQSGTGGGSITIRDSFNWTGTVALNTTNQYNASEIPSIQTDSITITNSTGFNRNEASFNITDVVAESDKRAIEEFGDPLLLFFTSRSPGGFTDYYSEIAMSFTIQEEYANLSKVRTYTDAIGSATGSIYIVNSSSNVPDDTLLLSSQENIISSGGDPLWHEYTFDNPVLLRGGITYFVVMNETSSNDLNDFWKWHVVADASGRNDGSVYYKYDTHTSNSWITQPGQDLPLEIEVLPVEYNGTDYVAKTYTDPTEADFRYKTSVDDTSLSAFVFDWNDTETHTFQTNTSVSFNLAFNANYTSSSNPLSGATSYYVQNATSSLWNVSFSTSAINTTFSVTDRTLAIQGLATDWDGSAIFHGSTLAYNTTGSGGLNGSVTYITNSDTMTIHASALSTAEAWNISFTALNYLLDLSLSQGGSSLDLPYRANVTDVLGLDFSVQATGNTSYWIDYPNGSQVRMAINVNSTHTNFSEEWDINASVDQTTNVNGTYDLQAFYISSDKTKVGTFTRQLAVFINTSLDVIALGEVIRGELFNVSTIYTAIHNNTGIKDVTIWCNTSWTTNVTMTPLLNGSYTVSLGETLNELPGYIGTVTITTQVGWFVNWTEQLLVRFVESSTLEVNTTLTLSLEWRENSTLVIKYNDSSTIGIPGANITVDGDSISAFWEPVDQVYYFKFNSTKYGGEGTYTDLTITATHNNYLNREWQFNLTITKGITDISAIGDSFPLTNDSTVIVKSYANNNADQITLNLQYYHILSSVNLDTPEPVIESPFPYVSPPTEELDLSWTIRLNPDKTGSYIVNISYSLPNFTNAKFIVHLTIENAGTKIETNYSNGTNVLYENSLDFTLIYNNTDYNEKITFIGNDTILISAPQQVSWLNRTGDNYYFRFASIPLGVNSYSILITFQHEYYDDASILILINVISGPTTITGVDINGTSIQNNTETYTRYFSPNEYDNFSISLNYSAIITMNTILVSASNITIEVDSSVFAAYFIVGSNNWTFIFNGSLLGTYLINITFSHFNYTSTTFTLTYLILQAASSITSWSSNLVTGPVNASVKSLNSIEFWMVWTSQYSESITDTTGVLSSNNTLLIFLNSTESLGIYYHYFRYTAAGIGIDTLDLTFGTENYTDVVITLSFEVTDRGLVIDNVLSTHPNSWTSPVAYLQYGDRYYFFIVINDSETDLSVDITAFSGLDIFNITFVNVTDGNHLFYYDAWTIATVTSVPLSIHFTKANYASVDYFINFFIKEAESTVVDAPTTVNTFYSQDVNFTILWQSEVNPNAPFTAIYGINSTTITFPLPIIAIDVENGNYTFQVKANQTGTFVVSINFGSTSFENQVYEITINIWQVPTEFGITTPVNASQIGIPTGFYYTDTIEFTIGWLSTFNSSGIQDKTPFIDVTGSGNVVFVTSSPNGSHVFKIFADELGQYSITITLETANFGKLLYTLDYQVSKMPTLQILPENVTVADAIYVEESFTLNGSGYQTYKGDNIIQIDSFMVWLNGTLVNQAQIVIVNDTYFFLISVSTVNYAYGFYNISLLVNSTGYETQQVNLTITLLGRTLDVEVSLPVSTIEQGQNITIDVVLSYHELTAGFGSTSMLAPWTNFTVHYYVEMHFANGTTKILETDIHPDALGHASYLIPGTITKSAVGFSNITVLISGSTASLPTSYSMSAEELDEIKITEFIEPLDILIPALIILVIVAFIVSSVYYVNRKRSSRSQTKKFAEMSIEQGFEDIKSIRLILARHQSGLQFYSEKTIAELQTDTDALSGMSAALSSFMEELSESMSSKSEEETERDKIEFLSREGLHMLIWHGYHSSFIIISEVRLPEYFQTHLKALGHELENKYSNELQDFYSSDQIPNTVVKKMVRKYIPLHYFSAYVLNEGVLTLDSVKLSRKYSKMFTEIKKVMFKIEGAHYFFSEQVISHLSKSYKRSEAIEFLDHAININLLIEADQKDLLQLTKL